MTPAQKAFLRSLLVGMFADRPRESVSAWCERELRFDEPDNRGPFTLTGREYLREPLDAWGDPTISDLVLVFGSQSGKTGSIMGGAAWVIANDPATLFWVMPTQSSVRGFSKTRWQPLIRASPALAALVPSGDNRHDFANLEQKVGSALVLFRWSNSPSALASTPARFAILDEVDKFSINSGGGEADAVNLAEQRTKSSATPKRIKTSTPSLVEAPVWQEFLKSDRRRRFLPCVHCGKMVVLAWSKEFTIFPTTGEEAFVKWDREAKREDGTWDLFRVEKSARYVCPHCGGHIRDGHKSKMDRAGQWRPTSSATSRGFRGWHLPSLYAPGPETSVGRLAVKFLQAKESLLGLQGFVNGDLAEPWQNQDSRSERVEIITRPEDPPLAGTRILTADYQQNAPRVWYVVREWKPLGLLPPDLQGPPTAGGPGDSRLVDFGFLDALEELREKQLEHKIPDNLVGIDSGFSAEEVYSVCLKHGRLASRPHALPVFVGWTPLKGFERRQHWRDPETKTPRPFAIGAAALPHKRFKLPLLEFSDDLCKDVLDRLRRGKTRFRWEVIERDDIEDPYFRHLDSNLRKPFYSARSRRVTWQWVKRARTWPDHLLDCEVEQVAMALLHRLLPILEEPPAAEENQSQPSTPDPD